MKNIFLASALLLSACAGTTQTHGQVITASRLAVIEPGTTTKTDVMRLLGSPSTQGTFNENRWYYITSVVQDKPLTPDQLKAREVIIIDFTPSDTVAGIVRKTQADAKDISPDETTTVTHGQSLGIIDSMMQSLPGLGKK